jgi:hypothetical protein
MDSLADIPTLYAFQDEVLRAIGDLGTGFYLTGGTAASRGYLGHRVGEGLELVVNDDPRFSLWAGQIADALAGHERWTGEVVVREPRFVRLGLVRGDCRLNVELASDAFAHVGQVTVHPSLGRLDSAENILADVITALIDRVEPEELADLWGFCCAKRLPVARVLEATRAKAAGIFPVDLARLVSGATRADWALVRWTAAPPADVFVEDLRRLAEELLLIKG